MPRPRTKRVNNNVDENNELLMAIKDKKTQMKDECEYCFL